MFPLFPYFLLETLYNNYVCMHILVNLIYLIKVNVGLKSIFITTNAKIILSVSTNHKHNRRLNWRQSSIEDDTILSNFNVYSIHF